MAESTERVFRVADYVLLEMQNLVYRQGIDDNSTFEHSLADKLTHEFLISKIRILPYLDDAMLFSTDGEIVSSAGQWPAPKVDADFRDHFRALKHQSATFFGSPVQDRTTGKWTVRVGRHLRNSAGEVMGTSAVEISLQYFDHFFSSTTLGEGYAVLLMRNDGTLLARYPFLDTIGRRFNVDGLQTRTGHLKSSIWRATSLDDGQFRVASVHYLEEYPVAVVATLAEPVAFEDWRKTFYMIAALTAAIIALIIVAGAATVRTWTSQERESRLRAEATESEKTRALAESELRRQRDLASQQQRFMAAVANMSQGLAMFDGDQRLVVCNQQYLNIYGLSAETVVPGCGFSEVLRQRKARGTFIGGIDEQSADITLRLLGEHSYSVARTLENGRTIAISYRAMEGGGWVSSHEDITERKNSEAKIERLAHYDALTNLANRNLFRERLNESLRRLHRTRTEFAVFLLDLDKFKSVNDTSGHLAGDMVLKEVASRISGSIREGDVAARVGGDEFALLVTGGGRVLKEMAEALAERLVTLIRAPFKIDGQQTSIGCSIGFALAPLHGDKADELLKCADLALYKSKESGRNCFHGYSAELKSEADSRNALENDFRQAIWREEFEIYYQPIIDTQTGRIDTLEALVRWRHPSDGLVSPEQFIPLAEETGLICQLGEWVMTKACSDAALIPKNIRVAVNLSPVQFARSNVLDTVAFALADSQLEPGRLELEITESVLLKESEQNLEILRRVQELGVSVALDDFGVGYSSLSYLTSFPFDKVKIDRSFIRKLDKSEAKVVVRSIVSLARTLDLIACAEGIETESQFAEVKSLGIGLAQGNLFGQPCPLRDVNFGPTDIMGESKVA